MSVTTRLWIIVTSPFRLICRKRRMSFAGRTIPKKITRKEEVSGGFF